MWFWLVATRYGVREVALAIRYPRRILIGQKLEVGTREFELQSVSTCWHMRMNIIKGNMIKETKRESSSIACHSQTKQITHEALQRRQPHVRVVALFHTLH